MAPALHRQQSTLPAWPSCSSPFRASLEQAAGALLLFMAFAAPWPSHGPYPFPVMGEVSLCFIADFAAAVLFGPCFGALAACGGSLIADALVRRKGAAKTAFNAGQFAVAGGLTGLTFALLQSDSSYESHHERDRLRCRRCSSSLPSTAPSPAPQSPCTDGASSASGAWPCAKAVCSTSPWLRWEPSLANAYAQSPWALLYFPLLVWVVYKGFGLYAKLRTETQNALVVARRLARTGATRTRSSTQSGWRRT